MPSSRTMSILIRMITMKPSALVSSATVPGTNSLRNASRAASADDAPRTSACFHALVICTACDTPIEKIRNGTRIDIGSMPSPSTGSAPSSQTTGSSATISASTVVFSERV
ncbi:hypothetical protein BamIOP4010DRAFT_6894 [Burkholderia ambifaria IOP40-10]|uniref:Uncharacterized protein n=1 Tax=Burkholderia ambifaria IOP40-10 TaxID=396596 RepID=B1FS81_9BURK|nr:hypothetical protein BamIOP4010DRAFT_6894 [Burkholderia ambifaria IOP40-10]